jgi:ubiquinone/menaquinone biosynthesis C-methylase UbiE
MADQSHFDEKYYNEVHGYDANWYKGRAYWVEKLTYGLKGKVLDVGCGRGYFTKEFIEMGKNIIGIDFSEYAVSHPMPGCEGKLIQGDILDIPFKDNFFEWTFCWALLEHIPEEQVPKALAEISRVAPLTMMCIAILWNDTPELVQFYKDEDSTHITLKNIDWWKEQFDKAGMTIEFWDKSMCIVAKRKSPLKGW